VVRAPVEAFVGSPHEPFDLVFCDPPWDLPGSEVAQVLERLRPALAPEALVVITRRAADGVPSPSGYAIDDERRHGDTRIIRYAIEREPQ
jgi:16S rRNA (guanine966-N2)-methyltransferase